MKKEKKPYVKPMFVYENFVTGELIGSPEMIEQILAENEDRKLEFRGLRCPFDSWV